MFHICEDAVSALIRYDIYTGLNQWIGRNKRSDGFMFFRLRLMDIFGLWLWFHLNDDSIKLRKCSYLKVFTEKGDYFIDILQIPDSSCLGLFGCIVSTHYAHNTNKIDSYSI